MTQGVRDWNPSPYDHVSTGAVSKVSRCRAESARIFSDDDFLPLWKWHRRTSYLTREEVVDDEDQESDERSVVNTLKQ